MAKAALLVAPTLFHPHPGEQPAWPHKATKDIMPFVALNGVWGRSPAASRPGWHLAILATFFLALMLRAPYLAIQLQASAMQ